MSETAADSTSARIGLSGVMVSLLLLAGLVAGRWNLPTDAAALTLAFCVGLWPLVGPAALWPHLARRRLGEAGDGPITVLLLILPFGLLMLGPSGAIVVYAGAAWFALSALWRAQLGLSWRGGAWIGLAIIAALLLLVAIGGSKYVNLFADQLALFGRTDGDVFGHGGITNSLRYFGVPSMGIDGIRLLHYHFGPNLLAVALATARDLDATFALVLVKFLVLAPLLLRVAASGALALGGKLDLALRLSPLAVVGWTVVVVALLPLTEIGNLRLGSESMTLGGILLLCAAPSLLGHWARGRDSGAALWLFWLAMIPLIAISKVSAGAIWFGLVGYTALRSFGIARAATWLVAGAAIVLFGAAFWLASDPTGMGGKWFGRPYYVERGLDEGDFLLPLRVQIEWLLALVALWLLARRGVAGAAGRLIEPLLIVAAGANLPGLLMYIPGGDAYYFITVSDWIATAALLAACAALWQDLERTPGRRRLVARFALAGLVAAGLSASVAPVKLGLRHFIAANALMRTGDLSYYDDDNKRPVREDAERAWDEIEHGTLLGGPPAPAPADSLLAKLAELRREYGTTVALYAAPEVGDFWDYLRDCDLSSVFPMAMAGVQMIDGYYPDQGKCRQEIGRRGYDGVPELRTARNDAGLCELARTRDIRRIYVIGSLSDRSRDRLVDCAAP
jgi:hypothetical protein